MDRGVYDWQAFLVAAWGVPSGSASGSAPPSLCHRILPSSHLQEGRTQNPGPAQRAEARLPAISLAGLSGTPRGSAGLGGGPGCPAARVPRSPALALAIAPVRAGARGPPCRPCGRPASGTDQAACERRDSCSCLKYAGYFYLPTSGGEGHPTSGRGGCYTMFPFSREGKWREARLPDHMVLKSMKKN